MQRLALVKARKLKSNRSWKAKLCSYKQIRSCCYVFLQTFSLNFFLIIVGFLQWFFGISNGQTEIERQSYKQMYTKLLLRIRSKFIFGFLPDSFQIPSMIFLDFKALQLQTNTKLLLRICSKFLFRFLPDNCQQKTLDCFRSNKVKQKLKGGATNKYEAAAYLFQLLIWDSVRIPLVDFSMNWNIWNENSVHFDNLFSLMNLKWWIR